MSLRRVSTQELVQYSHGTFPLREVATTEEKDLSYSITWTFDYTVDALVNPVTDKTRTLSVSYGFGSDANKLSSVAWLSLITFHLCLLLTSLLAMCVKSLCPVVRQQRMPVVMLMAQGKKLECGRDLIDWVGACFFQVTHFIACWRI